MMKQFINILFAALIISCNSNSKDKRTDIDTSAVPAEQIQFNRLTGCYMKVTGRDTAIVILEQNGEEITGKMIFDNYQKDGSKGTITGKADGDIIKLWYDFMSEGMNSKMEIYFKEENGKLIRGIGDVGTSGDSAFYKNPSTLNYPGTETFERTECDSIQNHI